MTTWQITHKPAYTADFVELNKNLQQAVVAAMQELEQDPITPRGNTIKKMTGYANVYRYRLGDFRLLYAASLDARMIQLLAIGPRSSVYQRFDFPGWDAGETAVKQQMADQLRAYCHLDTLAVVEIHRALAR